MSKIFVVYLLSDDEVLGCGGTLLKHVSNGDKVFVLFVSDGVSTRYKTSEKIKCTNEILKEKKWLEKWQTGKFTIVDFLNLKI